MRPKKRKPRTVKRNPVYVWRGIVLKMRRK